MSETCLIELSKGLHALVDRADYEWLSRWKWCASVTPRTAYACRNRRHPDGRIERVTMHRLIMDAPRGLEVDHINGNGLDNRRCNLRLATHQQNIHNSTYRKPGSSKYKGVSWSRPHQKWAAYIKIERRKKHLGLFSSEEDAARAYDAAAREAFREFARPNFP